MNVLPIKLPNSLNARKPSIEAKMTLKRAECRFYEKVKSSQRLKR